MLKKTSIQTRIVLPFVLLVVGAFGLTAFAAVQIAARNVESQERERIATLAKFISGSGFPLSQETLKSMGRLLDVGLATVSSDFEVRQSNLQRTLAADLPRALRNAFNASNDTGVLFAEVGGRDFYIAYAPVRRGSEWAVVLLRDAADVRAAQWELAWPILAAAVIAVILVNVAGWLIARSITRPLRSLAASTERIAAGDLSSDISVGTGDELEQLAQDLNRMARSLRTSQEELVRKEKLATLGSVAAGIAHEIRNPLTSMKMAAEMLSSGELSDSDREALGMLLDEIERLRLTTGGLLDYARPAAPETGKADVGKAISAVVTLMRRQLSHHKIETALEVPDSPVFAGMDQNRLKQVILNLILNACDAMPQGGSLSIRLSPHNDRIELAVTDSGQGIPEGELDRVFEPFYSTRAAGCGLGLAISKRFIEEAGGSIAVQSSQEGTTFTVTLPVQKQT
jgi:signal transduction histidine kinase